MQYEFLKDFPKRMKNVGLYTMLAQNSSQKAIWKQYQFLKVDEQLNLIFAVLLYIMEQSLKEENCTMDDISAYIDAVNMQYFKKNMSYEDCHILGDFIVNVVLSNEGRAMYFDCYNFEQRAYQIMNVSYVANRIVYIDQDLKRTSYYLTDDGYNLLLATLEVENNMKLTIHEMIFQLHLEKQSYDKAVDEIKNVFNLMRIQLQKIEEAMGKIRRNALSYSVKDYEEILIENLETISDTKEKFQGYRELIGKRVKELEEENINVKRLSEKEEEKLGHLTIIESYLKRVIDEHQRILNSHFDLKSLYTKELEQISQMSFIKRFPLRTELYDKILENPSGLERLDYFLRPLFNREIEKTYNLNKAFQLQKPISRKEEDGEEALDFDEEAWELEQEELRKDKREGYAGSLKYLLEQLYLKGEISLKEIAEQADKERLIPNVEIFKEIMVELIKNREIDIKELQREKSEFIQDKQSEFQLNEMLLELIEEEPAWQEIQRLFVYRVGDEAVAFPEVLNEKGERKTIRCSNVAFQILRKE
ncbi:MAG: hypothetical protein ACOCNL_08735 [Acetivibrio ethanolgignens]